MLLRIYFLHPATHSYPILPNCLLRVKGSDRDLILPINYLQLLLKHLINLHESPFPPILFRESVKSTLFQVSDTFSLK